MKFVLYVTRAQLGTFCFFLVWVCTEDLSNRCNTQIIADAVYDLSFMLLCHIHTHAIAEENVS